jgi:replicative DNA helicase
LQSWGLPATTLDSGAQSKINEPSVNILTGKRIVVLRDNDSPGEEYALMLASALKCRSESFKIVLLPGLASKGDICDWVTLPGNDKKRLIEIIKASPEYEPEKPKTLLDDIYTLDMQFMAYQKYIESLDKKRFITGFPQIDDAIRGVAPQETLFIQAYSGLFKSAWLQNILLMAAQRTELYQLFFSLEMPITKVFERTCQIALNEKGFNVERGFRYGKWDSIAKPLLEERKVDKMLVCPKGRITLGEIEMYVKICQDKFGEIGAVGIDYLGIMGCEAKTETERITQLAEGIKDLAKKLDLPMILLAQVNRASAATGEVEKWSGKGGIAIEASADYLLGMEKDDEEKLYMKILKNRNGKENLRFEIEIESEYLKFVSMKEAEKPKKKRHLKSVANHWSDQN